MTQWEETSSETKCCRRPNHTVRRRFSETVLMILRQAYTPFTMYRYSGTPVMRPQLLPHKNGHMRGVVVCQGHELF